MDETEHNTVD